MAKASSLPFFFLFFLILSFNSGGRTLKMASATQQKTWCVAKPSTNSNALQDNINWVCSQMDCTIMKPGCPCYEPNNLISHASIAMNLYYQSRGREYWTCNFKESALIVQTDPSYGSCHYA